MGYQSLHKAVLLLKHPVLWISGLIAGLFASSGIYFGLSGLEGAFYSERLFVFSLVVLPFFIVATYGAIKTDDYSIRNYIKEGFSSYFRVLLPTVFILSAALILLFLILMPVTITGIVNPIIFGGAFILIFIPFVIFVFFYDTAAVFEGKKVFECIKRSLEVSVAKSVQVLGFYVVILLVFFILFTGFSIIWSGILADQFEPLLSMSEDELNSLAQNPDAFVAMLDDYGVFVTAVLTFFGTFLFTTIFLPYKAVFYRDLLMGVQINPGVSGPSYTVSEGEYDEKGRWYKYS